MSDENEDTGITFSPASKNEDGTFSPTSPKKHYILISEGAGVQEIGYFQAVSPTATDRVKAQGFASGMYPTSIETVRSWSDEDLLDAAQRFVTRNLSLKAAADSMGKKEGVRAVTKTLAQEIEEAAKAGNMALVTELSAKLVATLTK